MLIPFSTLVSKYGLKVRGVVHVGAHLCEEKGAYEAEGVRDVVWLEANQNLVERQKREGANNIFHILASDKDGEEVDFNFSNNGQSSSMLELGVHKTYHPDVRYTAKTRMRTKRIDTLAKEQKWDISRYNFLNVDVQGADLMAIKGMDSLLHHFDAVYVEVNTDHVYVGCALLPETDAYLATHGFQRKELVMTDAKWGDAFYLRTTPIINNSEKRTRVLFDIGAHRGFYADAHMGWFDRLVLVEPNPILATFLRDKYKENDKVTVVEKVVTDEKKVTFYVCDVDTVSTASKTWVEHSRFSDKGFVWTPRDDLPTITMDQLIQQFGVPTRTKIDVEAHEPHVIKSLNQHIGPISFQWAEEVLEDIVICLFHLVGLGYTKFHIQNGDQYDFLPSIGSYRDIDQTIADINLWVPSRRDAWGMIHAL